MNDRIIITFRGISTNGRGLEGGLQYAECGTRVKSHSGWVSAGCRRQSSAPRDRGTFVPYIVSRVSCVV